MPALSPPSWRRPGRDSHGRTSPTDTHSSPSTQIDHASSPKQSFSVQNFLCNFRSNMAKQGTYDNFRENQYDQFDHDQNPP